VLCPEEGAAEKYNGGLFFFRIEKTIKQSFDIDKAEPMSEEQAG